MKTIATCAAAFVLLAGCGEKKTETKPAEPAATTAAPAPAPPSGSAVQIDPEVQKRIKEIVAKCKIDEDYLTISNCPANEQYEPLEFAAKNKVATLFESMGEIALTEGATDKKILGAIVGSWNTFKDRELQKKNSTPAAAERALKLLEQLPEKVDSASAHPFAYSAAVSLLAGQRDKLTAALEKRKAGSKLRASMFQSYPSWGGAAALPDIQAFYTKATTDDEKYAALWSVGVANFEGTPIAAADKTAMCDWVKGAIGSTQGRVLAGASDSLGRCRGAYIDALLTAAEAAIAKEKISEPYANAVKNGCTREMFSVNGSKDQCARALGILEKAVSDKDAPIAGLRQAMYSIGTIGKYGDGQGPRAKALLGKFTAHKDKQVADTATRMLKDVK